MVLSEWKMPHARSQETLVLPPRPVIHSDGAICLPCLRIELSEEVATVGYCERGLPAEGTMADRLDGKVVFVTGASGIAAAGARSFASEGASIFIISRSAESCESLASELEATGGTAKWEAADLTDEQAAVGAFASGMNTYGRIDGLFAVAGGSGRTHGDGPVHEIPLEGWAKTLELNGHPAFLAVREAVRSMLENETRGSIALVSSVLATSPVPDMFATHAYAAIKGAELALTISMASYYAPQGIRINAILPGLVDTPMAQRAASDPEIVAFAARKQPLVGGLLNADHVAGTALFLLSDESAAVTGQGIAVDGGWSVSASGS
jgi:NAD(P)-dependent dehydrogenase (short-subunit alcohol dehydrogenase family)